jgi:hypothetical protein
MHSAGAVEGRYVHLRAAKGGDRAPVGDEGAVSLARQADAHPRGRLPRKGFTGGVSEVEGLVLSRGEYRTTLPVVID